MATEVELKLLANVQAATKSVQSFASDANKAVSSVSSAFKALAGVAALVGLSAGIKEMIDAASEADESITALNTSLKISGEFSEKASQDFQNYASAVQNSTKFSEDAVLSNVALSKSYGLTNEQAKKVSAAALELATVQGVSLETATRQLTQTFDGQLGKLAKTVPALKGLTDEQLRSGAAADLVKKQFDGAAEAAGNTFSGASIKAKNAFGEVLEKTGSFITQNPVFVEAIKIASQEFNALAQKIDNNKAPIKDLLNDGIILLIEGLNLLAQGALVLARGAITKFSSVLYVASSALQALINAAKLLTNVLNEVFKSIIGLLSAAFVALNSFLGLLLKIPGVDKAFKAIGTSVKDVQKGLDDASKSAEDFAKGFQGVNLDQTFDSASESVGNFKDRLKNATVATRDGINEAGNALDRFKDKLKGVSDQPLIKPGSGADGLKNQLDKDLPEIVVPLKLELEASLVKSIGQGAAGAAGAVANVVGAIANSFLPGIGGIVTEIVNILAQGPEKVREFITGFIAQIPVIIENIILAIPALVQALIDSIPLLIDGLLASIPRIIDGLIASIPRIIDSVIASIPRIVQSLIEHIPQIITSIITAIPQLISAFAFQMPMVATQLALQMPSVAIKLVTSLIKEFPTMAKEFVQALIDELTGALGDIGGILGDVGGFLGFSNGGVVPGSGNTDTVPTMLTPGEIVIPKDIAQRMLGGDTVAVNGGGGSSVGGAGQMIQVVLQIGEKQLAEAILNLNRQGFRTA